MANMSMPWSWGCCARSGRHTSKEPAMLKGKKVILRAEAREDLKRLHELTRNLELVVLSDGQWQPEPLAQWEQKFDKHLEDADKAHFVIEVDGTLIGGIGLHHCDRRAGSAQFG